MSYCVELRYITEYQIDFKKREIPDSPRHCLHWWPRDLDSLMQFLIWAPEIDEIVLDNIIITDYHQQFNVLQSLMYRVSSHFSCLPFPLITHVSPLFSCLSSPLLSSHPPPPPLLLFPHFLLLHSSSTPPLPNLSHLTSETSNNTDISCREFKRIRTQELMAHLYRFLDLLKNFYKNEWMSNIIIKKCRILFQQMIKE